MAAKAKHKAVNAKAKPEHETDELIEEAQVGTVAEAAVEEPHAEMVVKHKAINAKPEQETDEMKIEVAKVDTVAEAMVEELRAEMVVEELRAEIEIATVLKVVTESGLHQAEMSIEDP